jgi:predicted N-acetyltransferase YhbS
MQGSSIQIRLEEPRDYRNSEVAAREAFWNKSAPGADHHFLLHQMRSDPDFIPELCFVAVDEEKIVGCIAFTRSKIVQNSEKDTKELPVISFGPIAVVPSHQSRGIGRQLISHALNAAKAFGHQAVVIYGDPRYYGRLGFRCGERYDITNKAGEYCVALMAMPLYSGPNPLESFGGGCFKEASLFENFTADGLEAFDATFPQKEKQTAPYHAEKKVIVTLRYKQTASIL